jgi:hypothetical protein
LSRAAISAARIDRDGETVVDRWKQTKAHPLLSSERDARAQFVQGVRALGFDLVDDQEPPCRDDARGERTAPNVTTLPTRKRS